MSPPARTLFLRERRPRECRLARADVDLLLADHRPHAERSARGPFLQGRLDVAAQVRDGGARKDALHCRFEEFTADVPCNRVPRAVAELVLRSPLAGERARSAVRQALGGFDLVGAAALGPESFALAEPDRLTEAYRPLLDLCRLLADGLAPGGREGAPACPAFLLDLQRVFEAYV